MDMCPKSIVQIARATKISEDSEVLELLRRLCKGFKTSLSDDILGMLIKKDYRSVIGLYSEVKPENYVDPDLFFQDRALVSFLAKYPFKSVTSQKEREKRALKSVADAEIRCRETNTRFHSGKLPMDVQPLILAARRKISSVLGSVNIAEVLRNCRWGPGTTLSISEPTRTAFFFKLTSGVSTTAKLRPFADSFLVDFPGWSLALGQGHVLSRLKGYPLMDADSPFEIVNHNRITTVPKTALSERPIAVEPHLNQFLQLGIGGAIRDRLKRVGIDIRHAQAKHRELARFASIYPSILATLDLSSASDTIAYRVVEELLPPDWFYLLNLARSDYGLYPDGTTIKYEKFSSMGNGYTFELETLIFYAISKVVARESKQSGDWYGNTVSVFGDDIICPTDVAKTVCAALSFFGFEMNVQKTFIDGPFRESCGGDYFRGRDVRPHYLKENPCEPQHYIALANGLRRFGIRHTLCGGPDVSLVSRLRVLDALPSKIRDCRGPEGLGDLVIHDEERNWRSSTRCSVRYFRVWRPVMFGRTDWSHFRPGVVLATALYGTGDGLPSQIDLPPWIRERVQGGVISRVNGSYVSGYRFGRVAYS